jgi:hypothetical protein
MIPANPHPRHCGLNVPRSKPNKFQLYQDHNSLLTLDQIKQTVTHSTRMSAEELFPAERWIGTQLNNGCNGWAAAGALARASVKRGNKPVILSGDFIYSHINGGSDNGSLLHDAMEFMQTSGICEDSLVKHGTWRKRDIKPEAIENAKRYRAFRCYRVDEEIELLTGLARGYCGVIAVHVNIRYETDENGTVYATDGPGNHAVCVDDLRLFDGRLQIRSPGSWGLSWGKRGAGWFEWNKSLRTTCKYHDFYLIRSTLDDPQGQNVEDVV